MHLRLGTEVEALSRRGGRLSRPAGRARFPVFMRVLLPASRGRRLHWSQAHDLSEQHPDKLRELQRLWLIEAVRHGVLPLDDRAAERIDPARALLC